MRFTFDPAKRLANLEKHGIDFEDAELILEEADAQEDVASWRRDEVFIPGQAG